MKKTLITIEEIRELRPTSKNIPQDRILPFILEAQQHDLKPVLGDALYLDFTKKFDQSGDPMYSKYRDLLYGCEYSYGGATLEFPGVVPFLVYATLTRYYPNAPVNLTAFGVTVKKAEESDQVDPKVIAAVVAELNSISISYQSDIEKFLATRATDYPLYAYRVGAPVNTMGVRFFDPDNGYTGNGRTNYSL